MNPQYLPPSQYGAAAQGYPPGKPGSGIPHPGLQDSFGSVQPLPGDYIQQQSPYGYNKGPMGPPSTQNNMMPPLLNQIQQGPSMQTPPTSLPNQPPRQIGAPGMAPNNFVSQPPQMHTPGHPPLMSTGLPTSTQNGPIMNHGPPTQNQSPHRQIGPSPGSGQVIPSIPPVSGQIDHQSGPGVPTISSGVNLPPGNIGSCVGPIGNAGPPTSQVGLPPGFSNQMVTPTGQVGPPSGSMGQIGTPTPIGAHTALSSSAAPPGTGQMIPLSGQSHMGMPGSGPPLGGQVQQSGPGMPSSSIGQMRPPSGAGFPPQGQILPTGTHGKSPMMSPLPGSNISNIAGPPPLNLRNQMPPAPGQYLNKTGGPAPGYQGIPPQINPGQLPPNQAYNQPPLGSNYPPVPNQLINQMNDMHVSGNRQYPGGPIKSAINGDNSPHMPPALPQRGQYVNGSQNRGPQASMGYQPAHGQQQQMPGGPYPPQPSYQQPKLDPDQMPSPVQVILEDQKTRSGVFCTNQKGLVPPLVSTNFITQDQGNAGPRYIRSTMYNIPTTSDMMKQTSVPFGLVISPFAQTADQEYPPPIVDFGELGPVRCIRCKAYMSPFMQFIDSGRRFQCLFCKATTEVPTEYFQHLDHTGQRVDRYERPELILGAYEFVATKDYCRNNTFPKPPAIIFVIDVSYNNVKSGLVHMLCAEMKDILKNLPIDQNQEKSRTKVGFITYNNTVHFYNIKGTLAQPQMMVVGDIQEMFMPLLDGFLCDIEDSAAVIDSLMQQIPTMFAETRETETVLLPAIQAGLEALKASECAGKLLVFHSTLPTAEAPGRLKNRDERKLLGTDKEKSVLTPQTQAYNQLGQDCVGAGCCVDLFITNNSYIDIATIGQVSRLTGGEIFKYTYFQADIDGHRLINDVITDISRPVAFDSIMRVRTSTGVRPTDFYGHFFMSNTTDMEIAAIDCDKAIAIEIKHDDKLTEEEGVYIQVALLYTSCAGQRRLRILNLSLRTCSQMADLYRSCELDTIVNFFSKQSVYRLLENNPKAVKDSLVNRCAQTLACYRKNCAGPSSAGQLILPECMKLLPLYVNCLLRSDAISGGSDMTLDDRSFVMQAVTTMDVPTSVVYFYPRLIPLHKIQNGSETPEIPNAIRCTAEKMVDNGVYLLENGIHMLIWIGLNASQEWIQNVFGVPSAAQVDTDRLQLPEIDNSLSVAIRNLVDQIRSQRHRCMRLTLVRQHDKLETVFRHFLVEDRGQDGSSSYVDFLCHMHKEIRQLLS